MHYMQGGFVTASMPAMFPADRIYSSQNFRPQSSFMDVSGTAMPVRFFVSLTPEASSGRRSLIATERGTRMWLPCSWKAAGGVWLSGSAQSGGGDSFRLKQLFIGLLRG